jgi:hypothetical protein
MTVFELAASAASVIGVCVGAVIGLKYGAVWSLVGAVFGGLVGYFLGLVLGLVALLLAHIQCKLSGEAQAGRPQRENENRAKAEPGTAAARGDGN